MTVISVIGPDARAVEQVTAGLKGVPVAADAPARRFVAGAGPGEADGVVAVVTGGSQDDAGVIRAVRDAMGVCLVFAGRETSLDELADEPGIVVCRWDGDAAGSPSPASVAGLRSVVDGMWVDRDRWLADARRADADRADRVRIAVRLAAERIATDILGAEEKGAGADSAVMDAEFRARLTVAVLEQGVEMPHLPEPHDGSSVIDVPPASGGGSGLLSVAASVGAGVAVLLATLRLAESPALAVAAGLAAVAVTAAVRWWAGSSARRDRDRAAVAAAMRRHWAATVTDVIGRLSVRPVAASLPGGAS